MFPNEIMYSPIAESKSLAPIVCPHFEQWTVEIPLIRLTMIEIVWRIETKSVNLQKLAFCEIFKI